MQTVNRTVSSQRVAEILRSARNLMNNGGRHWVKGTEKVDVAQVDPVKKDVLYALKNPTWAWTLIDDSQHVEPSGEYAYCSIGSIKAVTQNQDEISAAYFELAKSIDPTFIDRVRDNWFDIWRDNHYYDCEFYCDCEPPNPTLAQLYDTETLDYNGETAMEIITSANDADGTTWQNVSKWFTLAASRAKRRRY